MERRFLEKFEGQKVNIVLSNNFTYSGITFFFNEDGLVEFKDRTGEKIIVDGSFIKMLTPRRDENENS